MNIKDVESRGEQIAALDLKEFLSRLSQLCDKYGIVISSCGCGASADAQWGKDSTLKVFENCEFDGRDFSNV